MATNYRVGGLPGPQNPSGSLYSKPTSLDLTMMGSSKRKKGYSSNLVLDKTGGGY